MTDLSMEAVRTAAAETIAREVGICFEGALTAVDRALAAHDRTVKAEALREAAQQMHGAARAHLLVLALRIEGGATE